MKRTDTTSSSHWRTKSEQPDMVPLSRVLEIVEAAIEGWGMAIKRAERYGVTGESWVERDRYYKAAGESILNRLREEFEREDNQSD